MFYLAMRLVARAWIRIANIERDHNDVDSMADAWMKQQTRLRDAIAQAKLGRNPVHSDDEEAAKPADPDDEWLGPWLRQQARLKNAIARAKREASLKPKH